MDISEINLLIAKVKCIIMISKSRLVILIIIWIFVSFKIWDRYIDQLHDIDIVSEYQKKCVSINLENTRKRNDSVFLKSYTGNIYELDDILCELNDYSVPEYDIKDTDLKEAVHSKNRIKYYSQEQRKDLELLFIYSLIIYFIGYIWNKFLDIISEISKAIQGRR